MAEDSGEKSQDPTPHRRQQARDEGQVAKSQDLGSAVLLVLGLLAIQFMGGQLIEFFRVTSLRSFSGGLPPVADQAFAVSEWTWLVGQLARNVLPVLGLLLLGAIAVELVQVGFLFLPDKVSMDLTRLDPLKGFGRIFSLSNVVRLGFGIFKIIVVGAVAAVVIYNERHALLGLSSLPLPAVGAYLVNTLLGTAVKIGLALLILAVLDFAYQRWKYESDLRMTPQEVREEMKNYEGNPQVAARRKAVQRQLVLSRVSSAVPKADVVLTNPTELAIAIQYDAAKMAAPIVVAKGAGVLAQRIRKLALEHGVPIVEKKPLAQALYRDVDVNQPIPHDKYAAVAEVLAYVYQLKGKKMPVKSRAA